MILFRINFSEKLTQFPQITVNALFPQPHCGVETKLNYLKKNSPTQKKYLEIFFILVILRILFVTVFSLQW